jgi:hypothetical protein
LNQPIEKNPVKTAVAEFYVILVMFVEGVHRAYSCVVRYRELRADERLCDNLRRFLLQKEKRTFSLKKKSTAILSRRRSFGSREQTE